MVPTLGDVRLEAYRLSIMRLKVKVWKLDWLQRECETSMSGALI